MEGKVAFITGAGSGIGRASAQRFAAEGAKVVVSDYLENLAAEAVKSIADAGGEALAQYTDVTKEETIKAAIDTTVDKYGRLDVMFNCAGGSSRNDTTVTDVNLDIWKTTMGLDLLGTFLGCRYAIPHMVKQKSGVVINMGTWGAVRGSNPKHVYVTAKGGIISLTRSIAGEYSPAGIRANVICPGSIKTARSIAAQAKNLSDNPQNALEMKRKFFADSYPFSIGPPEDIANIALFLASDESRMITGAVIPADGGRSAF
ncbi:MAG: SDR family NAD(P)-dependent oxidoreductase [Pseudolabrys sp.]